MMTRLGYNSCSLYFSAPYYVFVLCTYFDFSDMRFNIKKRFQKNWPDLRSRLFRQQNSHRTERRDPRSDYARGSIEKEGSYDRGSGDILTEIDRLQLALQRAESENRDLKVTIEKLLERSFDQSLEATLHHTIGHLREENKVLNKRNNENDLLIEDLEKNYEELRHKYGVLQREMERDFVECPNSNCKEKFRSNELLKRHKRFNCSGAATSIESRSSTGAETLANSTA